jgi:hypothetical protein
MPPLLEGLPIIAYFQCSVPPLRFPIRMSIEMYF